MIGIAILFSLNLEKNYASTFHTELKNLESTVNNNPHSAISIKDDFRR